MIFVFLFRGFVALFLLLGRPVFFGELSSAFDLFSGLEAAFAALANPVHGVGALGDEAGLGAPSDDELARAATSGDAVDDNWLIGGLVFVHQAEEVFDLGVFGNSVIGDVEEVVVELGGHVFAIIELADVDHGLDAFFVEDVEDVGIGPPGSGDHSFLDPGEGFGALGLSAIGPIGRTNRHGWLLQYGKAFQ